MMASCVVARLWMFNLITLMTSALFLVSSIHTRQSISQRTNRCLSSRRLNKLMFGGDTDYFEDQLRGTQERDERPKVKVTRQDLASSIDAFNEKKCGKANYADDWMGSLNSFDCAQSLSTGDMKKWRTTRNRRAASKRIAGGYLPKLGDFPSMVRVFNFENVSETCGGVLIHNNLVLTAAHCVPDVSSSNWSSIQQAAGAVLAGTLTSNNEDGRGTLVKVSGYCVAPNYNKIAGDHDWALLRLAEPVAYSAAIQPACLELWRQPAPNVACVTAGFGMISNGTYTHVLRASILCPCGRQRQPERSLEAVTVGRIGATCYREIRTESMSANICHGDSGAGMYCFDNCSTGGRTRMYAVGVAAHRWFDRCDSLEPNYVFYTDLHKEAFMGMYHHLGACLSQLNITGGEPTD